MKLVSTKGPSLKYFFVLFVSILLGAAGVYMSKAVIDREINAYKASIKTDETMLSVVVPKRALKRGEVLVSSDLSLREIPAKYVDSNTVNGENYSIAIGQRVAFDVDSGRPLLWAHLDGGVSPTFSGKIEAGMRAMTMRVDEINSISGFLQPKDNIDLMITYNEGDDLKTYPFLQNLHILATGSKTVVDKNSPGGVSRFSTVTVSVDPTNAKRIILAQERGKITAVLRHPDDGAAMDPQPLPFSEVLPEVVESEVEQNDPEIEFIVGGV